MRGTFRDIGQLRDAPPWSITAVAGLLSAEDRLAEALRFVPYCAEHRDVWSPHFTQVILDAASQLDSVWKATTHIENPGLAPDTRLIITDHHARFEPLVAKQQVVFFSGESPSTIAPFSNWIAPAYKPLDWWDAYNVLKHDRFSNQTQATLGHAINAVAALLLAITYSGQCDLALLTALLIDSDKNPWAYAPLLRDVRFDCYAKVETKLFAHPIGIFGVDDCNLSGYWASDSNRFNVWWALNHKNYTKPLPSSP